MDPISHTLILTHVEGKKYSVKIRAGNKEVSLSKLSSEKMATLQGKLRSILENTGVNEIAPNKITIKQTGVIRTSDTTGFTTRQEKNTPEFLADFETIVQLKPAEEDLKDRVVTVKKEPPSEAVQNAFQAIASFFKRLRDAILSLFRKIFPDQKELAKQFVTDTKVYLENHKPHDLNINDDGLYVLQYEPSSRKGKIKKHELLSKEAAEQRIHKNVTHWTSEGYSLTPIKAGKEEIIEGRVYPTSFRKGNPEKSGHLVNCYIGEGNIIRSGVIDTEQKVNELLQVARHLQPEGKIRLVSHQLNSPEREKKLIKNQHEKLLAAAAKDDQLEIAHINSPFNRIVQHTKLLGNTLLPGEKISKQQNLEGLAQYVLWFAEDNPSLQNELEVFLPLIQNQSENLREPLIAITEKLKNVPQAKVLVEVLSSQLDLTKTSRAREVMLMQLLSKQLGVIYATNCMSGLDRTAISHSLKVAQEQTKTPLEEMALNWDTTTIEMNKFLRENGREAFQQKLLENPAWKEVETYRQRVFNNFINLSLPITAVSSGVPGLKWHKNLFENRNALNFIPSHIEHNGKIIQMLTYNAKGKAIKLTPEGRAILIQRSSSRSS